MIIPNIWKNNVPNHQPVYIYIIIIIIINYYYIYHLNYVFWGSSKCEKCSNCTACPWRASALLALERICRSIAAAACDPWDEGKVHVFSLEKL